MMLALIAILWLLNLNTSDDNLPPRGTALEVRVAAVLASVEGAGEVSVLIEQPKDNTEGGALIVSEGAWDIAVALKLQRAAKALLSLPIERIEVLPMRHERGGLWGQ